MKTEDKELLLKDLCARLPYNVYIDDCGTPHRLVNICWDGIKFVVNCSPFGTGHGRIGTSLFDGDICYVKPYLRPMSSMTEEEREEYEKTLEIEYQDMLPEPIYHKTLDSYYYLLEHHFDFRGLIPKDLALSTSVFNPYKD